MRQRTSASVVVAFVVVVASIASACVAPPPSPPPTSLPVDPRIEALLSEPKFIERFGESEQERADIVAAVRESFTSGDWEIPAADQQRLDAARASDEQSRQAELDDAAAARAAQVDAERSRLQELLSAPTVAELAAQAGDGSAGYDYSFTPEAFSAREGAVQLRSRLDLDAIQAAQRVDAEIAALQAQGALAGVLSQPGFVPEPLRASALLERTWIERAMSLSPQFTNGACQFRESARPAPVFPTLRPGTIYTPHQNTFADVDGVPAHVGELRTTLIDGQRHVVVEGHLGDLDVIGVAPGISIQTIARSWLTLHTPADVTTNYNGIGPFFETLPAYVPPQSGKVHVLCYEDDLDLPAGAPIRRAFFRAYLPMSVGDTTLAAPGFQVKATISELSDAPLGFFGADMRTVYLGGEPLGHRSTFDGGVGVSVAKGVVVDDNGVTGDDLESATRSSVRSGLRQALEDLAGTSQWVLGEDGSRWGWLGYSIRTSEPTTPDVDLSWSRTRNRSGPDDEYRLRVDVSADDWFLDGFVSVPFAALGIIPCYYRMRVDFSTTAYVAVDVDDAARTVLRPDVEVGALDVDIRDQFFSPVPTGCNRLYVMSWFGALERLIEGFLPRINDQLAEELAATPELPEVLPSAVPLANGAVMDVLFAGWDDTCVPYGCDGEGAGDVAMSASGFEATGDLRFTDRRPTGIPRRFPVSHVPAGTGSVGDRVRQHSDGAGTATDIGAWISPAVLNQALRVVAETGGLDSTSTPGQSRTAQSPPVFLDTPLAADKPLGLFLPHVEVVDSVGGNTFAVDAVAAVGLSLDPVTRRLVPNAVSPADPSFGVAAWTLSCSSTFWLVCYGVPAVLSTLGTVVANELMGPLLEQSVGQVTVPDTGGLALTGFAIRNEDGQLGVRTALGSS